MPENKLHFQASGICESTAAAAQPRPRRVPTALLCASQTSSGTNASLGPASPPTCSNRFLFCVGMNLVISFIPFILNFLGRLFKVSHKEHALDFNTLRYN